MKLPSGVCPLCKHPLSTQLVWANSPCILLHASPGVARLLIQVANGDHADWVDSVTQREDGPMIEGDVVVQRWETKAAQKGAWVELVTEVLEGLHEMWWPPEPPTGLTAEMQIGEK